MCWSAGRLRASPVSTRGRAAYIGAIPFRRIAWRSGSQVRSFYRNELFFTDFFDGSLLLKLNPDEPSMQLGWHRRGREAKETRTRSIRRCRPRSAFAISFTAWTATENSAVSMPATAIGSGKTSRRYPKPVGATSILSGTETGSGCSMSVANF